MCVSEQSELIVLRWGKYSGTYKKPGDIVFWFVVLFVCLFVFDLLIIIVIFIVIE
jgi:hypothetical protein